MHDGPLLVRCLPDGRELVSPQRQQIVRERDLDCLLAARAAPTDLVRGCDGVLARQAGDADEARRIVSTERGKPFVVRLHDCSRNVLVGDGVGHTQHAVEDFADDAITILRGDAQCWVRGMVDATRAVIPEPAFVHAIKARRLTAGVDLAGVAAAPDERKLRSGLVDPVAPTFALDNAGHAIAHRRRRVIGRKGGEGATADRCARRRR